ncbi:hypothetical protein GCM10023083_63010 [Streptomyces phyllanthi]
MRGRLCLVVIHPRYREVNLHRFFRRELTLVGGPVVRPLRLRRETAADVVMVAGRYMLLDQSALDDVLPTALALGKSVVAAGVFNSGLLSEGRLAHGMRYDYRAAPPELVARARAIADVCERHGTTLPAAAIAFPFTHPSVINVTLGMRTPEQVTRNMGLHRRHVPEDLWHNLRGRGLIRTDVPAGHRIPHLPATE